MEGYDPDFTPYNRLYRVIRGIKRTQGARFKKPPRIPITPNLLLQLGYTLWNSSFIFQNKIMLWAAMLTAFHGFLRVSEYTSSHVKKYNPLTTLCYEDIQFQGHSAFSIHIKSSKTDPFRQGTTIHIYRNDSPLCPFQALSKYMSNHPTRSGPLFCWNDGRYLTRSNLATVLSKIKPQHITSMSSHSFRIGAATTAAGAGYPRWLIQALGRWSSNCYKDYIRIPHHTLKEVSSSLAYHHPPHNFSFDPDNMS